MTKRIMLITDTQERALIIESILDKAGYCISARVTLDEDWSGLVGKVNPDIIFIGLEQSTSEVLEGVRHINRDYPMPVVMFAEKDDEAAVAAATQAGVSAYVVDGLYGERTMRIKAILAAAVVRFNTIQALRLELDETKARLQERKIIERAKGFLMKQRGFSEDDAYQALRKLAMDRNKRVVDVASSVVSAAELMG